MPQSAGGSGLHGSVYGGQQPIQGAHLYLLAAGTNGYGGASVSLLNATSTGYSDSIGAYVPTGAGGSFSLSGDYSCTPGTQVYLYALGGNPGAGTNLAIGLMAALGSCPASGTLTNTPKIAVNEASTIAAAYALAGYATDALHVSSSGTALAQTGIANAFANATNLVDLASGDPLATTPGGNGTVPQSEIDTLADILASCVNSVDSSTGGASIGCSALFALATSDGTATGTQPVETATAAINIAHHPGQNASRLFGLLGSSAPFQPVLGTAPNDFTILLAFNSAYPGTYELQPDSLAVDGSGNIWAVSPVCPQSALSQSGACGASTPIFEFNPLGVPASATGFLPTPYTLSTPVSIAVDATSSNVWITDSNPYVSEDYGSVGAPAPIPGAVVKFGIAQSSGLLRIDSTSIPNLTGPTDAVLDASGNVWVADSTTFLFHLNGSTGSLMTEVIGADNGCPGCGPAEWYYSVAMEPGVNGNVWATSYRNGYISAYSPAGVQQTGSPYFVGISGYGSLSAAVDAGGNVWLPGFFGMEKATPSGAPAAGSPFDIIGDRRTTTSTQGEGTAIDGDGNAWLTAPVGALFELNHQGTLLTGPNGYVSPANIYPDSVAVDGSGNVWYNAQTYSTGTPALYELVGAAAPVVTPIAYGVQTNQLGTRP